ncbi:MAG: hypothetical protein WCP22_03365 [Chlamydiota bacterium]
MTEIRQAIEKARALSEQIQSAYRVRLIGDLAFRELYRYGDDAAQILLCWTERKAAGDAAPSLPVECLCPPHSHDNEELIVVVNGWIEHDGVKYARGECMKIARGVMHAPKASHDARFVVICIPPEEAYKNGTNGV